MDAGAQHGDSAVVDGWAVVEAGATLDPSVRVGPGCHVHGGAVIGAGSVLEDRVIVGSGVELGQRVVVSPGACLQSSLEVGDDVRVGPNVVFVEDGAERLHGASKRTVVRDGASVGANATVMSGLTIGRNAAVGAGAVVTRDVPPNAIVVGSPARIIGYRSTSRDASSVRFRGSTVAPDRFPVAVGRATLHHFPQVDDLRGSLSFGQVDAQLPFVPRRYFLVYAVPSREVRGEHAHRELHQLLVCVSGECAVAVDDGSTRSEVMLDRPNLALHLPPMVWGTQYQYSPDAVLLVLASAEYDDADYIRDYEEFEREVTGG